MCKEDVRLARAAHGGSAGQQDGSTALHKVLGANPERYSLCAGYGNDITPGTPQSAAVGVMVNGLFYGFLGLSQDHPAGVVTIFEVGQLITSEIWVRDYDTTSPPVVNVIETKWDVPQDRI